MRVTATMLIALFTWLAIPAAPAPGATASAATGDLSVTVISEQMFFGVAPGDTLRYFVYYGWDGDAPAPGVQLEIQYDASLYPVQSINPEPTSHLGGSMEFDLGTLSEFAFGLVEIMGVVPETVPLDSEITLTATISGDVTDEDPENNTSESSISVQPPSPDLWVWKWGLLEELEQGLFFAAETDVPTTFNIYYFNWANYEAENTVVTDSLPPGVELISAIPEPTSVDGSVVTWDLGTLEAFGSGEIVARVRPTEPGSVSNVVTIATTSDEQNLDNNRSEFHFDVLELLPPRLLKPNIIAGSTDSPAIVGRNTPFQGLARAGATVTLYEGAAEGCFGDFSGCNPVEIGSTVAGPDRTWEISGVLDDARDYYLYVQAELDGAVSQPSFQFYQPYVVRIDSILDKAGFDLDHFTLATENQTAEPGTLGGSSGMTPNEDWTLNIRQQAPPTIETDAELQENHTLRLEIFDGNGQTTEIVPVTEIKKVEEGGKTNDPDEHFDSYDFIYVQKGFGPGSRVEIWCLPVYYTEDGLPLVGLVYVKCHEMLIDPAGYVYDIEVAGSEYEWPSIPPEEALITNATVTALRRTGDDEWARWEAEESGQVNPQVTDEVTEDRIKVAGYYAFYVPAGQYQVNATAEGYADYVSPILTVIDAPVFHNVGMRLSAEKTTDIEEPVRPPKRETMPTAALLHQNYPNPFNPSTTISYALMQASEITLTVHNLLGQEVARLVQDVQQPGMHHIRFDAGDLPSGVYFYQLKAGESVYVKKMTLVR